MANEYGCVEIWTYFGVLNHWTWYGCHTIKSVKIRIWFIKGLKTMKCHIWVTLTIAICRVDSLSNSWLDTWVKCTCNADRNLEMTLHFWRCDDWHSCVEINIIQTNMLAPDRHNIMIIYIISKNLEESKENLSTILKPRKFNAFSILLGKRSVPRQEDRKNATLKDKLQRLLKILSIKSAHNNQGLVWPEDLNFLQSEPTNCIKGKYANIILKLLFS